MNRHLFLSLLLALFASSTLSADNLRIEPTFWWSGMKNPELQLMVYGKDIAGYLPVSYTHLVHHKEVSYHRHLQIWHLTDFNHSWLKDSKDVSSTIRHSTTK